MTLSLTPALRQKSAHIPSYHSSGFTLAEGLVTLSILGIVAAIVLPITIRKFEEKILVTKASKTYALIESIGKQVLIMNGPFEAWDLSNMSSYKGSQTIYNYFKPYLKIHKVCEKMQVIVWVQINILIV